MLWYLKFLLVLHFKIFDFWDKAVLDFLLLK